MLFSTTSILLVSLLSPAFALALPVEQLHQLEARAPVTVTVTRVGQCTTKRSTTVAAATTAPSSTPVASSTVHSATATTVNYAVSPSASATASSFQSMALSEHNNFRAKHNAPALVWNATLASAAQSWSDKCVFKHSGGTLGPYGENLAVSFDSPAPIIF